jgi:hypothetical protein
MLVAYYDLQTSPPTYDIVAFLLAVEHHRIRCGESSIAIRVLPGPVAGFRRDKYWPFTITGRNLMLNQVATPMARMLPSATEVSLWRTRLKPEANSIGYGRSLYGLRVLIECLKHGVRPLRAPNGGPQFNPKLITMTLREAEHWPERNSNVAEWISAAKEIMARGHRVVIVRDTYFANVEIEGIETSRESSLNLNARAQLYRSAACNLFVSNGPGWFALALDAPVLMMKPTTESINHCSSRSLSACGLIPGQQIPNAPAYQKIIWDDDNAISIVDAFDQYMEVSAHDDHRTGTDSTRCI